MVSDKHLAVLRRGARAWNDWRRSEPLMRPELEGLSLTLAQKQWGETNGGPINLSLAVLNGADLRHATLNGADLGSASLIGADLSGARLKGADLRNANLSRAYLDGADLSSALLDGANLQGTDLSGARYLSPSQLEGAKGDRRTRLPPQLAVPDAWHGRAGHVASASPVVGTVSIPSAAAQTTPPAGDPHAATRATLEAVARAGAETAAAVTAVEALGATRASGVGNALEYLTSKAAPYLPHSSRFSRIPEPMLLLMLGVGALVLLFGVERLLSLRDSDAAVLIEPSAVVAVEPETKPGAADVVAADEREPVRVKLTPAPGTAPAEDVAAISRPLERQADGVAVTDVDSARVGVPENRMTAVEEVGAVAVAMDRKTRMAFAMGEEGASRVQGGFANASPVAGGHAKAHVESYLGEQVEPRTVGDTIERTDPALPDGAAPSATASPETSGAETEESEASTQFARLEPPPTPEPKPRAPPKTLEGYLSTPNKSSDWIKVFIRDYYLSGAELGESDLRRIYSSQVEYFGEHKVSLSRVAREKAQYYRDWPKRRYDLIPGSIAIDWRSEKVAEVTFTYDFNVSSPKKGTHRGRGRARLTLDLRAASGLITREDGEVIRSN